MQRLGAGSVLAGFQLPSMGKSPGRWIKTVLFGKKSSKHNVSKKGEVRYAHILLNDYNHVHLPFLDLRSMACV